MLIAKGGPVAATDLSSSEASIQNPHRPLRSRGVGKLLKVAAWVSFVLNTLIIATGGTVRLTASGLGCTDWPVCTPGEFTPIPEMGIHGVIEFANRTITGPLLLVAILVLVLTLFLRPIRKDLIVLSAITLFLVIAQALVGAFVVWLKLNANLVGVHYVASLILVAITAAYLVRMYAPSGPRERVVPQGFMITGHITTLFYAVTVIFGVLTTGAGPHSGDANVIRQGIDATFLSHVHAWPSYVTFALLLVLVIWSIRSQLATKRWSIAMLIGIMFQIAVGIYQARNGLPPVAVGIHMVFAALTGAALTVLIMRMKAPRLAVTV